METISVETLHTVHDVFQPVFQNNTPISVSTNYGDYVVMSAKEYAHFRGLLATYEIEGNKNLNAAILDNKNTPREERISHVDFWTEKDE